MNWPNSCILLYRVVIVTSFASAQNIVSPFSDYITEKNEEPLKQITRRRCNFYTHAKLSSLRCVLEDPMNQDQKRNNQYKLSSKNGWGLKIDSSENEVLFTGWDSKTVMNDKWMCNLWPQQKKHGLPRRCSCVDCFLEHPKKAYNKIISFPLLLLLLCNICATAFWKEI